MGCRWRELGLGEVALAGLVLMMAPTRLDAQTVAAVRLSVSSSGEQGNGNSESIGVSRDFRSVLFRSVVRLLGENGRTAAAFVPVPAQSQRTLDLSEVTILPSTSVSIVVESEAPIVWSAP